MKSKYAHHHHYVDGKCESCHLKAIKTCEHGVKNYDCRVCMEKRMYELNKAMQDALEHSLNTSLDRDKEKHEIQ